LPRLAQEAPKSVLRGGAAMHKNRVAEAIPNQNSRNLVQITALLLVYRHLHRKYKIYCSKTRCKTTRKTIEYLQNAIPVF
jgi:hypothetical protein